MGRLHYKNTFNNTENNMVPPEISASISARPEQPKTDEAERNDIKNNFIKMIEVLKEEMKDFLKEMGKIQTKIGGYY